MNRSCVPASTIPDISLIVPKFTSSALLTLLRSSISWGEVAMMGLAPNASVTFADWLTTTELVIYMNAQYTPLQPLPRNEVFTHLMNEGSKSSEGGQKFRCSLHYRFRRIVAGSWLAHERKY
jgi:hypothetical protein